MTAVALVTNLDGSITIALSGSDADGDSLTSQLTSLPALGGVFLTSDGLTRGALVANVPTVVTGLPPRVIYVALGVAATNQIRYKVSDGFADSTNAILTFVSTNNPAADADGDGLPDLFELANNLNPLVNDAGLDPDADGLTNLREFQIGTRPGLADTDSDGLSDGVELVRGTNPLNPDTDGDGIPDGSDPNPLGVNVGMVFSGTNRVDLVEGRTTNLVLQVESTNGPIALLDYAATNLPPAFVTVKSRTFSNTSSNGVATLELEFNPLHDAAGESVMTLRAANQAGESITFDVRMVVADNPALTVTHWKDPVNGNWTDSTRWDNGLPGPTNVAVIDVAGSYTVSLNTSVAAAGIVLNSSDAVLKPTAYLTLDAPIEVRRGHFDINTTIAMTLNRPLANRDRMRWISRYSVVALQGTGRIENAGVWELFADPACPSCANESHVPLPVNVPVGGKLLLSTNALVNFGWPSSLTVAGELEVQSGARLRFDGNNPAVRSLSLQAGSVLRGNGSVQLDGNCRLVAVSDLDTTVAVVLNSATARIVVSGIYTVRASQSFGGVIEASAVVVASNAVTTAGTVNFGGTLRVANGGSLQLIGGMVTFGTNVLVGVGGRLDVPTSTTLVLSGTLTNQGGMRWASTYNVFNLNGSGRVENRGLWEIYRDPIANYGYESVVRVPVNVPVGGKLLLSTNAMVNFSAPSSLSVAGELEVQSGARLRLDGSSPARDVTLAAGSVLSGTGTLLVEGSSRLVASGDLDTTMPIVQSGSGTRVVVGGVYRVRTSSSLSGTVEAPLMTVMSNVVLTANNAAFTGRLQVEDGGSLQLTGGTVTFGTNVLVAVGARLDVEKSTTLVLSGTLTNQGVMRWVSAYNVFDLNGSGRVENLGLWEIYADPIVNYGSEPVVRVPVNVPVGGKLLLSTNAVVNFSAPSSLSVAGELEVQSGARLRLDGSTPARDLTLSAGSALYGTGTIQIEGSCRLVVPGDLDTTVAVVVNGAAARLVVPGVYTVRTSRSISGVVESTAVVVTTNAVLTASGASFSGPVTLENGSQLVMNGGSFTNQLSIEGGASVRLTGGTVRFGTNVLVAVGARLDVEKSTTLVLSGTLTNQGVMRWVSAYNVFDLNGSGQVENPGLWEVYWDQAATLVSESVVRVPVNVPVGGKLLLSTNAVVNFSAPSSLSVAGELEVQSGARLRLDGSTPARDLTLAGGSLLGGSGTLRFEGGNRLVLSADTTLGFGLVDFLGSSSLVSSNTLTIASGAIVRFDHNSTINGPVVVNGTLTLTSVSATLRINAALTLNAIGTISNSGVIGAFAFVNNGGTISGNAPSIISPAFSQLRINQFILTNSAPISALDTGKLRASDRMVILKWTGAAGEQFSIESTTDLRVWTNLPAAITESVSGTFQATLPAESVGARFYRLLRR